MDPTAAYRTMMDYTADPADRADAADALAAWIDAGGFLPAVHVHEHWTARRRHVLADCADVARDMDDIITAAARTFGAM